MNPGVPPWSDGLVPFVILAAAMVGANLYLLTQALPRRGPTPHFGTVVLVVGLLVMSAVLWLAVIDAIVDPGDASTVAVFIAGNSMMGVFGAWIIAVFYRAEEHRLPTVGWGWPAVFALLVVGSELLMGTAFVLAIAGPQGYVGPAGGPVELARDALGSAWFAGAMLANMILLLAWLPLPTIERRALAGLAASAILVPWVVSGSALALAAMGALMAGVLGTAFWQLERGPASVRSVRTVGGVGVAFAVMMVAGLAGNVDAGSGAGELLFALASVGAMGAELAYLGHWALGRSTPTEPPAAGPTSEGVVAAAGGT